MKRGLAAFVSGLLFAAGLCLAGMTRPSRILAFLDVTGRWDPSLAAVMAGAIVVAALAFRAAARRPAPALGGRFDVPPPAPVRGGLLAGAAIFGVGWGLTGLCPGPAIVSLASGQLGAFVFVGAMVAGMLLQAGVASRRGKRAAGSGARAGSGPLSYDAAAGGDR